MGHHDKASRQQVILFTDHDKKKGPKLGSNRAEVRKNSSVCFKPSTKHNSIHIFLWQKEMMRTPHHITPK
jgi:hypothetical protein